MTTVRYDSGVGLQMPTSGELIGLAAGFLRLKSFVAEADRVTGRTAERYYRGERVEPDSVQAILDALTAALLPSLLIGVDALGSTAASATLAVLVHDLGTRWDKLASTLNSGYFPIISETDAPIPFLRMFALDLGLRWAAYQALRVAHGREPLLTARWLAHDSLRVVMDELRGAAPNRSLANLAAELRVSRNTMDAWRAGKSLPTEINLDELAAVLAADANDDKNAVKSRLRLAVGISAAWHKLASIVSDRGHVTNLVLGFDGAAKTSFDFFKWLPLPLDETGRVEAIRAVVHHGAKADAGVKIGLATSAHLASSCDNQWLQADVLALPGDWTERLNEWFKLIGTQEQASAHLAERMRLPLTRARELVGTTLKHLMTMSGMGSRPPEKLYTYCITGDDAFKAGNRVTQAELAWSVGDRRTALEHMQRAVDLQPGNPAYRRNMGSWVGELVAAGCVGLLHTSLVHLRAAVKLDPTDAVAATEIGIVLSNAGLLEEAEAAYAGAEAVASPWHHYHEARGINFVFLGCWDRAEKHLRRALELEPKAHRSKAILVAILMKRGNTQQAKALAREVQHRTRHDPLRDWEGMLTRRPNSRVAWTRVGDSWLPKT